MGFSIRPASKPDLQKCAAIVFEEFSRQAEPWTIKTAMGRVSDLFEHFPELCFCLEFDGKLIGLIFCERFKYIKGDALWIAEFAISAPCQGKGYGVKALQFIEKFAKDNGFYTLLLAANVKEKAIKIYKKFGFKTNNYVMMEKEP